MITDERQGDCLLPAIRRLPRGSGIVFRHYGLPEVERRILFDRVKRLVHSHGLMLFLAGGDARAWGAHGSHGIPITGMPHSASVHDIRELRAAEASGASFLLVSPVFATRSHPGAPALGPLRFNLLARSSRLPVIALGGMNPRRAAQLNAYGWAAIDALTPRLGGKKVRRGAA
jgi:thiamine-phosphate pyrophosphorylase